MFIFQNWYSKNRALRLEVSRIIDLLCMHNVDLAARYINTAENVLADALSRVVNEQKIRLDDRFVEYLSRSGLTDRVITH